MRARIAQIFRGVLEGTSTSDAVPLPPELCNCGSKSGFHPRSVDCVEQESRASFSRQSTLAAAASAVPRWGVRHRHVVVLELKQPVFACRGSVVGVSPAAGLTDAGHSEEVCYWRPA